MSKIKFDELQVTNSQLSTLDEQETGAVVGGRGYYRRLRNDIRNSINISNIVQINNNINIQLAFNGDNFNIANLNNNAGASQG